MRDYLERGSILFYCKKIDEANRVHNVLLEEGYEVVKHQYLMSIYIMVKEYQKNI